jgi:putative methionine-R-sulfoxide reductase with GAF domain
VEWLDRTYPSTDGISGRAWRTGEIQRVDDLTRDPDYISWTPASRSALAVPVAREGLTRGILYLEDETHARYTPSDLRIMRALVGHAWIALRSEVGVETDRFAAAFSAAPSSLIITSLPR